MLCRVFVVRVEDGRVAPDLDDTVRAAPRTPVLSRAADLEDTIARAAVPAPPPLVEPPAPERRPDSGVPRFELPPTPARAGRKPVFWALLADGAEIPIDVTVYLGRRPSVPRIHAGPEPRLVTLPSPGKEVSGTHLELRVVGGAVVASDMRSTNGTVVQLPGAAPRTLIRGESAVVVPGTRIDLGEGAVIDILPARDPGER